ncbi:MAG: HIT family protein [Candidatus Saccharibacteria bacterium]
MDCRFCNFNEIIIAANELAFAVYDKYPVTEGHILVIPKRHVASYFDTSIEERTAIDELLNECKRILDEKYQPDGYNIGINCGEAAGQTIFHVHVHLIPRYIGDVGNPRGGVRGIIPGRKDYKDD